MSGYISASWYGWPLNFYITSVIGLLWCILFYIYGYEKPHEHPTISAEEKLYIEEYLNSQNKRKKMPIPFRRILTSIPYYAFIIERCCLIWVHWTQASQVPSYLNHVMKFNIKSSGLLTAIPYLGQVLGSYFFSFLSDYLIEKKIWSINVSRKTMAAISSVLPAIALVLIGKSNSNESSKVIALLVTISTADSASFSGPSVNILDLSPNFSGFLMGVTNTISHSVSIFTPIYVQYMVVNEDDPEEWSIIFYTTAIVSIIGGMVFIMFGSTDVQPWNHDGKVDSDEVVSK
ncbi:hypothetical protein JTB14_032277 [Gonioctena quinquepunctata]|nr:hypothetical protein JTB14_032277 [Gonioctena quinquepunctata]